MTARELLHLTRDTSIRWGSVPLPFPFLPSQSPRSEVKPDAGRGHECERLDLTLTCRCVNTLLRCPFPFNLSPSISPHVLSAGPFLGASYLFNLKAMFCLCLCFVSLLCFGFCSVSVCAALQAISVTNFYGLFLVFRVHPIVPTALCVCLCVR